MLEALTVKASLGPPSTRETYAISIHGSLYYVETPAVLSISQNARWPSGAGYNFDWHIAQALSALREALASWQT